MGALAVQVLLPPLHLTSLNFVAGNPELGRPDSSSNTQNGFLPLTLRLRDPHEALPLPCQLDAFIVSEWSTTAKGFESLTQNLARKAGL